MKPILNACVILPFHSEIPLSALDASCGMCWGWRAVIAAVGNRSSKPGHIVTKNTGRYEWVWIKPSPISVG